mgnify:CR=1 FL=1
MDDNASPRDRAGGRYRGSRASIVFLVLATVAAWFLLAEHRAHLFGALPYLLLLACPLMHMFMHGGHGGHGSGRAHRDHGQQPPRTGDPS